MDLLQTIRRLIEDLEAIDFGYLEIATDDEREATLTYIETIVDEMNDLGLDWPEADLTVRFFLIDPERSRQYLYGPTDVHDGAGLIDKLKDLAAELEADQT